MFKGPGVERGAAGEVLSGFCAGSCDLCSFDKSRYTTDMVKAWSNFNMFLFGGTLFYATDSPIAGVRNAVTSMIYYQAARSLVSTAASYQSETKRQDKIRSIAMNGISSGLTAGGLSLLFAYRNTLQYRPFILLASSASTALVTTFFYVSFGGSEKMSVFEKAPAVAGAIAGAVAVVLALVGSGTAPSDDAGVAVEVLALTEFVALTGALAGVGAEAVFLGDTGVTAEVLATVIALTLVGAKAIGVAGAGAVAVAGTITEAVAIAEVIAVAGAVAVAGVGAGIIMMTGCISSTMLQRSDATAIGKSLTVMAATGLPLMVSSWLVSLERFAEDNVAMHETMQNELIFSLPVSKVLSLANWVNWPVVRGWFTD